MAKTAKAKQPPRPVGRPSKYSNALVVEICKRLSVGEPLAVICRDEHMPHPTTVRDWSDRDPSISLAIARAREDGEDYMAAECLGIADDSRNDYMAQLAENGDEKAAAFNGEHVQRSKLRIETRLKLLAKWNPKKYGDKLEIAATVSIGNRLQEARERAAKGR